ncbi:protein crumbs homolog 2-like [Megalops cyprinoides]|uniref:protein crumbs homolog 2-like n=1 Tax=Megalops cyprinoides TaxID=118141 RepID=UPI001864ACE2|nr:protein crumbs homolog 2-like [Megalops cyprinoides]
MTHVAWKDSVKASCGVVCAENSNRCSSSPCLHGATCTDTSDDYVCICPTETVLYMGKDCERLYDGCAFAGCPNCTSTPGTTEFTCFCPEGYSGKNCTLAADPCESSPCSGVRTQCVATDDGGYTCVCPGGYSGEECETPSQWGCSGDPCLNNGTCVGLPGGFRCECGPGYRGERCEEDVDECGSQPCQNGAICMDGVNSYLCFCVPGFQGYHCEIDINECASRPCENNGTCINGKDRYHCECLLGYMGVNCEVEIDECESNPCKHGATCHDHVGLYTCQCPLGFEGLNCEIDIDECASAPCLNEGTCNDLVDSYECDCSDTGFMGDSCEVDIPECASNPCQNNATCQEGVKSYTCLCWPGYMGDHCEVDIDECAEEPCENGGTCFERSDVAHYGTLPKLDGDFSYADAAGYLCECLIGFTGENCSINIDECESAPCQNGASCEDLVNAYKCACLPGFTGTHCEVEVDECESHPCQNGALCEDGIADYTCHCPAVEPGEVPWGGRNCDVRLVGCQDHQCENGATCWPHFSEGEHGYSCLCPPGFYDEHCSTPTTFSFSVPGFFVVQAPGANQTSAGPAIKLRFRTTLPDAVLLYRGGNGSYLTLELVGGRLQAKAGSEGVVLRAGFSGAVNDGDWREVSVALGETLALVLKGAGCDGEGCLVSDGRRDVRPAHTHSLTRVAVGGAPAEYLHNTDSGRWFLGCMEDLLVDSQPVLPQRLTPPQAPGLELGCRKTEWCLPDPCSTRGLCVDLWNSFRCDCHRPFHGTNCTEEYRSWTFGKENSVSYASYEIRAGHRENFSVSFFLRSLKEDGLIVQLRRRGGEAYLTVYLQTGRVTVGTPWATPASAPVTVTTGERTLLTVEFWNGNAALRGPDGLHQLPGIGTVTVEEGDEVYVGGLPEGVDTAPWGGHFKGCLQDLRLDRVLLDMQGGAAGNASVDRRYAPSTVSNVWPDCVSDDACQGEPCQNGGECTVTWNDFVCECPRNFTGKTCETRVWCVSDPCVMGTRCVDLPDGYECHTNATFEDNALQFGANGSLVAPVTSVSMELRTREENGVLLRASRGSEMLCVGLLNSTVLVKIRSGDGPEVLAFTSRQPVSDGDWHRLEVAMAEPPAQRQQGMARWAVTVDGQNGGASLGTAGSLNFLNESVVWLAENYTGCLGEVRVGGVLLPFVRDPEPPQQARFLQQGGEEARVGCEGSPVCLSQPCLNGGTCEDLFHQFSCSCAAGWEGPLCQDDADDCASSPCVRGTCSDRLADFHCDCPSGYSGKECAHDLDECQGHACQNGGTCLDGVASYTCACPPNFTGPFCQWSFPPLRCNEDLQCVNGGVCSEGIWGANCSCIPGFTGDRCEAEVDECDSNPCQNGGSCIDRLNKFQCVCPPGFMGPRCENSKQEHKERVPLLVVAIPLACCCVLLAVIGLTFMVMTARKKRQSEGTYSPSQQEVAGARLEMDSVLKVPPEERLI